MYDVNDVQIIRVPISEGWCEGSAFIMSMLRVGPGALPKHAILRECRCVELGTGQLIGQYSQNFKRLIKGTGGTTEPMGLAYMHK